MIANDRLFGKIAVCLVALGVAATVGIQKASQKWSLSGHPQAVAEEAQETTVGQGNSTSGCQAGCCPVGETGGGVPGNLDAASVAEYKKRGDWCTGHAVPESMCTICNPRLIPDFKARGDWCAGHDVPESLCTLCNPGLSEIGIGRDWCQEHGVPESQCTACQSAKAGIESLPLPRPETPDIALETFLVDSVSSVLAKPGEGPSRIELPQGEDLRRNLNPNCLLHLSQVRLASPEIARKTGIEVTPVGRNRIPQTVECYGEIEYDRTRYAVISPRDSGIVSAVFADLGRRVRKGETLALIDSVEFGEAKAAYLRAQATLDRWTWINESYRNAGGSGAISRREAIEARADLESASVELAIACQKLSNFGLGVDEIQDIANNNSPDTLFPVRAPFDAEVVSVNAAPGERVEAGFALFQIADLSRMWAMLDLSSRDLSQICLGQEVSFVADTAAAETFRGEVTWIDSCLDGKTRTAKVRAELDNQNGLLRAGLFGKGSILIHNEGEATVVPRDAVQWDGCCNVCFVEQSPGRYQPRKVRLGNEDQEACTVLAGLLPGERVVTQGSYLLKTEILKGSIGAGCCGND